MEHDGKNGNVNQYISAYANNADLRAGIIDLIRHFLACEVKPDYMQVAGAVDALLADKHDSENIS